MKIPEGDAISFGRRKTEGDLLDAKRKGFTEVAVVDKRVKDALLRLCELISPSKHKVGILRMPPGTSYQDELFKVGTTLSEPTQTRSEPTQTLAEPRKPRGT